LGEGAGKQKSEMRDRLERVFWTILGIVLGLLLILFDHVKPVLVGTGFLGLFILVLKAEYEFRQMEKFW
jgi:hypothetical protein